LGRKYVDVVELRKLFRRERLRRTEGHVTGVVDHHIEAPIVGDDFRDTGLRGLIGGDIEFDGPEIDAVVGSIARDLGDL